MDASKWNSTNDLFLSFFDAVKAPAWHGKNFNALRDSIGVGAINGIEVPYCLVIENYRMVPKHLRELTGHFIDLIHELSEEGVKVKIRVQN